MTTKHEGKYAVLENFQRPHCQKFMRRPLVGNVLPRISVTRDRTAVIFSAQIEIFNVCKMIIKHEGKYAALENFQRPHCQKFGRKPLAGTVWFLGSRLRVIEPPSFFQRR